MTYATLTVLLAMMSSAAAEDLAIFGSFADDTELTERLLRQSHADYDADTLRLVTRLVTKRPSSLTISPSEVTLDNGSTQSTVTVLDISEAENHYVFTCDNGKELTFGVDEHGAYRLGGGFLMVDGVKRRLQVKVYMKPVTIDEAPASP